MDKKEILYDLIVCTCDAYEDTWIPFFTLLKAYWPGADSLRIILTTEKKDFTFPGLDIICAKTGMTRRNKSKPWGARILASLELIQAPLVLFMLDDFFINRPVRVKDIDDFAEEMLKSKNWGRLELNPQGMRKGETVEFDKRLVSINSGEPYRVNAQPALWRKNALMDILRSHESAWDFEHRGTIRSQRSPWLFVRLSNTWDNGSNSVVIHHITDDGIRRGRWRAEIVCDLFKKHGISVDLSKRGFYERIPDNNSNSKEKSLIRRVCRKDILQAVFRRLQNSWSEYKSFR